VRISIPSPQKVRKVGNSLVVTIPADFAEQHNIDSDMLLQVSVEPVEQITIPRLDAELQQAVDQVLANDQDALRHLRGH
jgi:putative addiction module antidote